MANADNINGNSQPEDAPQTSSQTSAGAGGRRYRKKDDKRGSGQSQDSSNTPSLREKETNQSDADIQRIKLNRLSNYEVDDVKMANVFGSKPTDKKAVSSSMRLNPLYDQDGTVEVSSDQAHVAKSSDTASQDSGIGNMTSAKSKKGTYKRPKKAQDEDEEELPVNDADGTKINYSKNFRFGRPAENGVQNGAGVKKLTTFGVVMPSRVKQNTIPKNQLVAPGDGVTQYALSEQDKKAKPDIEAARRRHEIRRRWRYVIILILIILFFGLILTVVLYFATRAP
ncbi:uncharacterized protein LOC117295252 [Asterias rubens]|uniref:uncharacterized protein LOC117295252 n=1 Tax=Asterias rubens TaxID=7604 RepID=UPI00145509E7|nr:uncharacterized protein LOC117295252 [Asterias rubens]